MAERLLKNPNVQTAGSIAIFNEAYCWLLSKPAGILVSSRILDLDMGMIGRANISELMNFTIGQLHHNDKLGLLIAATVVKIAVDSLVRSTGTRLIGRHYGVDTTSASHLALIPFIGGYPSVLAQIARPIWERFRPPLIPESPIESLMYQRKL